MTTLKGSPRAALLLAIVLTAGAARAAEPATVVGHVLFAAAELTLLGDMLQTLEGQRIGYLESNPLLGAQPSTAAIVGYFGALVLAEAALHAWGPPWLSNTVSGITLVLEVPQIGRNLSVGLGFGFRL